MEPRALQLGPPPETERADAARNREAIICAARRIIDATGVDSLTMDAVAKEAGIGKGTVFRRFGSRAQLMQTLLNEWELDFQRDFFSGPPPLGPGAEPVDRLIAFGHARLRLLTVQGDLLRAAEGSTETRYSAPARAAASQHIAMLLRAAGVSGDTEVLTFTLMSALDVTLVLHESRDERISMDRLADGWEFLIRRVTAPQ